MKQEIGACIVDLRGGHAAALTEDGRFVRIRNQGYEVGQTVRLGGAKPKAERRAQLRALVSVAAGLLLLILGGFQGYQTPVGIVSLDVNPSIEYTINCFDRVLTAEGVNEDGERILDQIDESLLMNLPIDEAVEQTIQMLRDNGYLELEAENDVMLSASSYSTRHAERLAKELKERVALQEDLAVTSVSVTNGEVEQAHALGASAGKLYLVERLQQATKDGARFDQADWLGKPIREIMQKTQEQESMYPPQGENGTGAQSQGQIAPSGEPSATPNPRSPQSTAPQKSDQPADGGQISGPSQGSQGGKSPSGSSGHPNG